MTHLTMVNCGVILKIIISAIVVPLSQYTLSFSRTSLSLNQCHVISHVIEHSGIIPDFTNPSIVEFSVLRGVSNCRWSNVITVICIRISVFPCLKVPHISDSAAEDTTMRIVLHSVSMGTFILGVLFIGLGEVQSFR